MYLDIALNKLLMPIPGESVSGSDLRYTTCYEEIMEARRSDDAVSLGDWRHSVKSSDWEKVVRLCVAALSEKTKDLQISAWLAEALTVVDGFAGLELGLRLTGGLVREFWDTVYPLTGGDDLEYRAAPFDFLNEKVTLQVKQVPITDKGAAEAYSWADWHRSRLVGYEADTVDRYGGTDEEKMNRREGRLAEHGIAAEVFDAAAAASHGAFSQALLSDLQRCRDALATLTELLGERFGACAPTLSGLTAALEVCAGVARTLYGTAPAPVSVQVERQLEPEEVPPAVKPALEKEIPATVPTRDAREAAAWIAAVAVLDEGRLQDALGLLLEAGSGTGSVRGASRIRLLMAKLCLQAGRPDLARPIVEELHAMIQELQLERWESGVWIAEVLDAYYRCLTAGERSDEDINLSRVLFRRICALDVTRAISYRI